MKRDEGLLLCDIVNDWEGTQEEREREIKGYIDGFCLIYNVDSLEEVKRLNKKLSAEIKRLSAKPSRDNNAACEMNEIAQRTLKRIYKL